MHLAWRRLNIVTKILRVLWFPEYRSALLRAGVWASTEHDELLRELNVDTVVDIGANRGQFALCARRLFPKAQIYSFEPLQKPARTYLRNFANDPRARLFNSAVADAAGQSEMHVSRRDASSSLLPIAPAQHRNFPFTEESGRETVSKARLSDCIGPGDISNRSLLKLDVQGFEMSALRGCEDLLPRFEFVYVEASFIELYVGQALATDIVAYLLSKGFKLACVANISTGRSKRPIQADFLFSRH
jgi:FkbM family methyltransferase